MKITKFGISYQKDKNKAYCIFHFENTDGSKFEKQINAQKDILGSTCNNLEDDLLEKLSESDCEIYDSVVSFLLDLF